MSQRSLFDEPALKRMAEITVKRLLDGNEQDREKRYASLKGNDKTTLILKMLDILEEKEKTLREKGMNGLKGLGIIQYPQVNDRWLIEAAEYCAKGKSISSTDFLPNDVVRKLEDALGLTNINKCDPFELSAILDRVNLLIKIKEITDIKKELEDIFLSNANSFESTPKM